MSIKIISSIISDNNGMKIEINHRKRHEKKQIQRFWKQIYGDQRGNMGGGGINYEVVIDICTLLCMK